MKISSKLFKNFFIQEIPSGTIDGVNTSFTLSFDPLFNSTLLVFANGLLQRQTNDYTISGNTITFVNAPPQGTLLYCFYLRSL